MEKYNEMPKNELEIEQSELANQEALIFEYWEKVVGAKPIEEKIETEQLTNERIKENLYKQLESALEDTISKLGIEIDDNLVKQIEEAEDTDKKTFLERELIVFVVRQFKKISHSKWSFFPKQIQETQSLNCSGSAMLTGYLLEKYGIKSYCGYPASHAVNIVNLADNLFLYVDSHKKTKDPKDLSFNIVDINNPQFETVEGINVLKIDMPNIPYKLVPVYFQKDSILSILGNFNSLKRAAEQENDFEAITIYNQYKDLLEKTNLRYFDDNLYPETHRFYKTKVFIEEEERIKNYNYNQTEKDRKK